MKNLSVVLLVAFGVGLSALVARSRRLPHDISGVTPQCPELPAKKKLADIHGSSAVLRFVNDNSCYAAKRHDFGGGYGKSAFLYFVSPETEIECPNFMKSGLREH